MIVGDLFSGIGGFSLAAHWMGWRTAWFSEIDPYAIFRRVEVMAQQPRTPTRAAA